MINPPNDISPSALFLKLTETPFPSEVIDFPRRGSDGKWIGKLRVRVLTQEDQDRARFLAHERLDKRGLRPEQLASVTLQEVAADAVAKELIAMACLTETSHGDDVRGNPIYGRIFVDGSQVGKLTGDEVVALFNAWQLVQRRFGPIENRINVEAWIARLEEAGSVFPLVSLPSPDALELAFMLSERICSISKILSRHSESLPPSLVSELERSMMGIFSFGERLSELESTGSESSLEIDDALELTRKMRVKQAALEP